jgi:hypothetical protein
MALIADFYNLPRFYPAEKALYVSESNFHVQFKPALGTCKLPYRRYENRCVHDVMSADQ